MPQSPRNLGLRERTLTALSLLLLVLFFAVSGWLWRWDLAFYDLQLGQCLVVHAEAPEIVVEATGAGYRDHCGG